MNEGIISGKISNIVKNDKNVTFDVTLNTSNGKQPDEVFPSIAYNDNGETLSAMVKEGNRVIFSYRVSSVKNDKEEFIPVLGVNKVLGVIEDASKGTDFINIIVGGATKFRNINNTSGGSSVMNGSVLTLKEFQGNVSKTYIDVALWNELANKNADKQGQEGIDAVFTGTPKISTGTDGKVRISVWATSAMFVGVGSSSAPADVSAAVKENRMFRGNRSQKDEDINF